MLALNISYIPADYLSVFWIINPFCCYIDYTCIKLMIQIFRSFDSCTTSVFSLFIISLFFWIAATLIPTYLHSETHLFSLELFSNRLHLNLSSGNSCHDELKITSYSYLLSAFREAWWFSGRSLYFYNNSACLCFSLVYKRDRYTLCCQSLIIC